MFKVRASYKSNVMSDGSYDDWTGTRQIIDVDLSIGMPKSSEIRPINTSVKYFIRSVG